MKRDSKIDYYRKYFEANKNKASSIWKGIMSIVNIHNSSKKDIKLLNDKGSNISDPKKIVDLFNKYFVKVGPNIDERIPKANKHFTEYMSKLKVNKTIFLTPATPSIFKKDSPLLRQNYRPISLLPIFNKIFEKVIYKRMYDFAEQNKLIYERQVNDKACPN